MPAFTTNQWAILFLVLVLGWVLGLASRSGGARWKRALAAEREERAIERERHAQEIAALNTRIVDLEARPVPVAAPVAALDPRAETPVTGRAKSDDLSLIHGIGPVGERRLNEQGIHSYRDIIALDANRKSALESRVGAPAGTIDQDRWQEQAIALEERGVDEHRRVFG
ncbi:hypothetical protein PQ455_10920 [Sphingomonas naphthae]|uniref:DUF4332 domain-containing protein n=1 Tax=Sphingomonas naphthae TaxID=1813468 RepID=A0ABY7TG69_9SPHN|nr:hypothetical protein [Sphingomonas naphthae]WCT72155.1 hypothetical protein PQ455_10920 [Sphingomonas naphthae]